MVHRAWVTVMHGGFITHGETFHRDDEVLWRAKGGKLYGQSPDRFAFLKAIQYEIGDVEYNCQRSFGNPNDSADDSKPEDDPAGMFIRLINRLPDHERRLFLQHYSPAIVRISDYRLQYFGINCASIAHLYLPENGAYKIEVLDVWEMTRETLRENVNGRVKLALPGKEGIAILVKRLEGDAL